MSDLIYIEMTLREAATVAEALRDVADKWAARSSIPRGTSIGEAFRIIATLNYIAGTIESDAKAIRKAHEPAAPFVAGDAP